MLKLAAIGNTVTDISRFFDISRFLIFKSAASAMLDFKNLEILLADAMQRVEIGQSVADTLRFFLFSSRWRPLAILDLLCACLDHPQRASGGLYHCAKFGWNQCSSFNIMHVLWISRDWLENAYSRSLNWFFGGITPEMWSDINETQKDTSLSRVRVV